MTGPTRMVLGALLALAALGIAIVAVAEQGPPQMPVGEAPAISGCR